MIISRLEINTSFEKERLFSDIVIYETEEFFLITTKEGDSIQLQKSDSQFVNLGKLIIFLLEVK